MCKPATWRSEHQEGDFSRRRTLTSIFVVVAMIPLTHVLRKIQSGYEFTKSKEKINHLLYMDDLKLYAKNEKELDSLVQTVRVFSNGIGM